MREIIRAGIDSIDRGQRRRRSRSACARARDAARRPAQADRVILPPLGNEFNNMLKTTSLVFDRSASTSCSPTPQHRLLEHVPAVEYFIAVAFWYLVLTIGRGRSSRPRSSAGSPTATGASELTLPRASRRRRGTPSTRIVGAAEKPRRHRRTSSCEPRDVHKRFGRLHVLKGVSLDGAAARDRLSSSAPSGSGKTTFIRCINHLEKIDGGPDRGERPPDRLPASATASCVEDSERNSRAQRTRDRDGLPALQPVPAHDRARERHRGAGCTSSAARSARRPPRPRRCSTRVGLARQARRVPGQALRRPAAARRDRARARDEAGADALRRADERARPGGDRRGARR